MLTVDFEQLNLQRSHRLLDMGCGGGRHAFAAWKTGATVVALDMDPEELGGVVAVAAAMHDAGELPGGTAGGAVNGDALGLPFADASFDRIIASEVLEHVWEDEVAISELTRVLRPGGRIAVTVPAWLPEKVCWALDSNYHDTPGGHVRIFRKTELVARLEKAGLTVVGSHHAHALHAPYWWLRCALGVENADALPARTYHRFLVWELTHRPRWTRIVEQVLSPVLGKSLIIYADKPAAAEGIAGDIRNAA